MNNQLEDVNRMNFPDLIALRGLLYEMNFNKLLSTLKDRIIVANNNNETFIRVLNNELHYDNRLITDMKNYLTNKAYGIVDIEDNNGNSIGWRLNF